MPGAVGIAKRHEPEGSATPPGFWLQLLVYFHVQYPPSLAAAGYPPIQSLTLAFTMPLQLTVTAPPGPTEPGIAVSDGLVGGGGVVIVVETSFDDGLCNPEVS